MRVSNPLLTVLFATTALIGCNGSSSSDDDNNITVDEIITSSAVRVLHASSDAPKVNITVNGENLLEQVDYLDGSELLTVDSGDYQVGVDAILPDGSTATVIGPADLSFAADTEYAVIAVGNVADDTLMPLIIERPFAAFGTGNIRLQVAHASSNAPAVDIYLTAPNDDIDSATPALAAVPFMGVSGLIEVAAGDYQARITLAGTKTVVFDSGALPLSAGTDLILAAVNNTLTGSSPVAVVAWSNAGTGVIADVNAGAELRVIHGSPDAPPVNVLANGNALVTDLAYGSATPYVDVPAATYNVQVEPSAAPGTFVIDADLSLEQSMAYTVIAIDNVASIRPWVLMDMRRRIATEAGLRLLHGSAIAGEVDIYLGTDSDISDEMPAFTAVPLGAETGRLSITPGDYYVTVTPTGSSDAAIGPLMLTLEGGKLYTAIARDQVGGGAPLGLILLDDFVTEE